MIAVRGKGQLHLSNLSPPGEKNAIALVRGMIGVLGYNYRVLLEKQHPLIGRSSLWRIQPASRYKGAQPS